MSVYYLPNQHLSYQRIDNNCLLNRDCTEFTVVDASTALDALGAVDNHRSQLVAGGGVVGTADSLDRASLGALAAADALLAVDDIAHKFLADTGTALLVDHVLHILVPEVVESRQNRVRRGLAKAAQGGVLDNGGQVAQLLEVIHRAAAVGDLLKDFAQTLVADTAGRALAAALLAGELEVELGDSRHTARLVHNNHTARAHHRAGSNEAVIVDSSVEVLGSQASARRTTGLDGLELTAVLDAAANLVDNLTQGDAHRNLDKADVVDLACEGKHLRAFRLLGSDAAEPLGALGDDDGNVGESLDIVHVRGLAHIAADSGERRFQCRLAALTFHRVDQSSLLTADESAGTVAELDVEVEAAAEDVLAKQTVLAGLVDSDLKTLDSQRVLGTDVDQTLAGADSVAADGHSLDDAVGVALKDRTVHKCTRVALVGVADDVLLVSLVLGAELPFQTGGEAGTATAAQTRSLNLGYDLLGGHLGEALAQSLVTATADALLDVLGIYETAVAQGDTNLFLVEVHMLRVAHVLLVLGVGVEQLGHLAALDDVLLDDAACILGLHLGVESVVGHNLDDGAALAETEAAGLDNLHVVGQTLLGKDILEVFDNLEAVGALASGTAAD